MKYKYTDMNYDYYQISGLGNVNIDSLRSAVNSFNESITSAPAKCIRGELFTSAKQQRIVLNTNSKKSKRFQQVEVISSVIAIRNISMTEISCYDEYNHWFTVEGDNYIRVEFDYIYDTNVGDKYDLEAIRNFSGTKYCLKPRILGVRKNNELFVDRIITFDMILYLGRNEMQRKMREHFIKS